MSQNWANLGYWPKLLLYGLGLRKSLIKNRNTFISVQVIIRIKHKLSSTWPNKNIKIQSLHCMEVSFLSK